MESPRKHRGEMMNDMSTNNPRQRRIVVVGVGSSLIAAHLRERAGLDATEHGDPADCDLIVAVADTCDHHKVLGLGRPVFFYCEGRLSQTTHGHDRCVGAANSLVTLPARVCETLDYLDFEAQRRLSALIAEHKSRYEGTR